MQPITIKTKNLKRALLISNVKKNHPKKFKENYQFRTISCTCTIVFKGDINISKFGDKYFLSNKPTG